MATIKSFAVGVGDMFYIDHGSDSFTVIDCDLNDDNSDRIIAEISERSSSKGISRFISTHPDDDHFGGLDVLDDSWPIYNFYAVNNEVWKSNGSAALDRYRALRDGPRAYHLYKGCSRKWLNSSDEQRGGAGINVLWPDLGNPTFKAALASCNAGGSPNNISCVLRYSIGNASVMWLGDLETSFMEAIYDHISLQKTTVVFAAHHGRVSGKIPNNWLYDLDPQFIVIGESPSRHLHYYTGYKTITQNTAGDITMDLSDNKIHFYVSNASYAPAGLSIEQHPEYPADFYVGSLTPEIQYTR